MTRKSYVYDEQLGRMVERTREPPQRGNALNHLGGLWSDRHYDGMRATDGSDISSRRKHREYMKRNNLTTTDDFKDTWAKAQQEREAYRERGGTIRRQDVLAAIQKLQHRR